MSNLCYRPKHHISICTSNIFSFIRIAPYSKGDQLIDYPAMSMHRILAPLNNKIKVCLTLLVALYHLYFYFCTKVFCDVADSENIVNQGTVVSYSVTDNNAGSTFLVTSKTYRQRLIIGRFFMSLTVSLKFDKNDKKIQTRLQFI